MNNSQIKLKLADLWLRACLQNTQNLFAPLIGLPGKDCQTELTCIRQPLRLRIDPFERLDMQEATQGKGTSPNIIGRLVTIMHGEQNRA